MPVLNDEEYPDLNHLDLIVTSLYKRYRKREDHFLSAFWAKSVAGLFTNLYVLTLFEIAIECFNLSTLKKNFIDYYYYPFAIIWISLTYAIHRVSIPNKILDEMILFPEEYLKGQKLSLLHYILSLIVFCLFLMYAKS